MSTASGLGLPPGQHVHPDFPRFGLPWYAHRTPRTVPELRVEVVGPDGATTILTATDLARLPRRDQESDLHCVTTWSQVGLRWSGVPFRTLYEQVLRPSVDAAGAARFVRVRGLDGYTDTSLFEDVLADNVLLATSLAGAPLGLPHGAPLRLVTPDHYGYKNVKHVVRIELRRTAGMRWPLSLHHPRARVAHEERFHNLPGHLVGQFYRRLMLAPTLWWFRRTERP
ncbi:MAG: hypothetical protein QOD96_4889 [Pseudonocardiales bacterium]|nr:hypothetical protein [Pseudonocardiales bacterium]